MNDANSPRIPDELLRALEQLQRDHRGSWLDIVADAVVEVGGTDAGDLLALSADRAAAGIPMEGEGDPEAALTAMEADLARIEGHIGTTEAKSVDLLAELPPVQPDLDDDRPRRSMN